ncbi:trimeric intracellular cation channel family protein [Conexibacter stalactiti]|uniref:Trimeric intracellular cation channel family protein n=1 Tax=Conexibacter stalactiti TaxID=1940611 RepID=A0ABU4HWS0_9ACTN|nr:trimeric intracellular cation channel family protein [Conexibacter stalactiti]MDW5597284.1 trimeric intracellular cation channel family protein [Conexibacter stalactiti]MEC5037926.1 trimeric intracellular cation channel family protein [Conexibacter stalactiti]
MEEIVQTPIWLDLLAVFVGAISGALLAVVRGFDVAGVFALAIVTGIGGGMIRDVLLNQLPASLDNPWYLGTALAGAAAVFFFAGTFQRMGAVMLITDAVVLGLYGIVGAEKAIANGLELLPAILLGMITTIGGGTLRDVLTGRPPEIFQEGELYAVAALAGVVSFVALDHLGVALTLSVIIGSAITFGLRVGAWRRGWRAPTPVAADEALIAHFQAIRGATARRAESEEAGERARRRRRFRRGS